MTPEQRCRDWIAWWFAHFTPVERTSHAGIIRMHEMRHGRTW